MWSDAALLLRARIIHEELRMTGMQAQPSGDIPRLISVLVVAMVLVVACSTGKSPQVSRATHTATAQKIQSTANTTTQPGINKAEHKYFFVTDADVFIFMKRAKYTRDLAGVTVVLLPDREEYVVQSPEAAQT